MRSRSGVNVHMHLWQAILLGVVEGLTEFLPVSSTGHLTLVESALGLDTSAKSVTAFTAIIQDGAIVAVVLYFLRDIVAIVRGWFGGLVKPELRGQLEHRLGWHVIVGTIPIGIAGLLLKNVIEGPLRSLWAVVGGLLVWSVVIWAAEHWATQRRPERELDIKDAIVVGVVQVAALVPGVSRSGATISAGLFRGLDRVAATRFSFLLSIPALLAAGLFEAKDALGGHGVGAGNTAVATAVSFVVGYASVAWLLRFVAHHTIAWFVPYRVALAAGIAVALAAGLLSAT